MENKLTIAELKERLDEANIEYKQGKKKKYYKTLYKEHILEKEGQVRKRDFETLEEKEALESLQQPIKKQRQEQQGEDENKIMMMEEIEAMSLSNPMVRNGDEDIIAEEVHIEEEAISENDSNEEKKTNPTPQYSQYNESPEDRNIQYESERLLLKRAKEIYDEEQQQADQAKQKAGGHTTWQDIVDHLKEAFHRQKKSYLQIAMAFSIITVICIAIFLSSTKTIGKTTAPTFCDTEPGRNFIQEEEYQLHKQGYKCDPCPNHGYCIDGELLECENPFVKEGRYNCIRNTKEDRLALQWIQTIAKRLNRELGEFECGYRELKPTMSVDQVVNFIQPKNETLANATLPIFSSILKERQASKRYGIYINVQEGKENDLPDYIIPTQTQLPMSCVIKRRIFENQALLFAMVVIFIALYIINRYSEYRLVDRVQLEDVMGVILTVIREQAKSEEDDEDRWIYVSQLKELLEEEYGNEFDVTTRLWPEILIAARSHPSIIVRQSQYSGEELWKWRLQ